MSEWLTQKRIQKSFEGVIKIYWSVMREHHLINLKICPRTETFELLRVGNLSRFLAGNLNQRKGGGGGGGCSVGMLKFRTDRLITVRGDVKVKQSADSILNLELFSTGLDSKLDPKVV